MENKICVITGGGSGIGLATAKEMGKKYSILISGRTKSKLENALNELKSLGIEAEASICDISDRKSTDNLARLMISLGRPGVIINAAGLSPNMGKPETIMAVNAMGAINMHNSFYPYLENKNCFIDISSMSAYFMPKFIIPRGYFELAQTDPSKFMKKMMKRIRLFPKKAQQGLAYGLSKAFLLDYVKREAARFGAKGIRVLSVSPGNFDTPMGSLEQKEAQEYIRYCAVKRLGQPEEMARLLALCADEQIGYLTGVDILCDGGCVASGINPMKRKSA